MSTPVGLTTLVKSDLLNIIKKSDEFIGDNAVDIVFTIYHSDGTTETVTAADLPYDGSTVNANKYFKIEKIGPAIRVIHYRNYNDTTCPEKLTIKLPTDAIALIFAVVETHNWNIGILDNLAGGFSQGEGHIMLPIPANTEVQLVWSCGRYTTNNNESGVIQMYIYLIEEG